MKILTKLHGCMYSFVAFSLHAGSALGVAQFEYPTDVAFDPASGALYVSQWHGWKVRKIYEGVVSTIVTSGVGACLGMVFDPLHTALYLVVSSNLLNQRDECHA